jgi:two-component system, chemotaxis family, chemotaxis protein CheY
MRKLGRIGEARILVIDDEPLVRMTLGKALGRLGVADLRQASDGEAGLTETMSYLPDLVFCDVHMPRMSGLEYLEKVRTTPVESIKATPVVFLTSDRQEDVVVIAKSLRVDGYIVKPVTLPPLQKYLERILKVFIPRVA